MTHFPLIIIGGGATGLFAALSAARYLPHIAILEAQSRCGKKLLATGNGRCNLSNLQAAPAHYHGAAPQFVEAALTHCSVQQTLDIFRTLGIVSRAESDGKIYPYSNQAASVLDVLRFAVEKRGITLQTDCRVSQITAHAKRGFTLQTTAGSYTADAVILACGGQAAPQLGGVNDGYRLAAALGHRCTPLLPALVQIKTDNTYPKSLKGIKFEGIVTLTAQGSEPQQAAGEILFTEFGVSGPPIFALSRTAAAIKAGGTPCLLHLDLMPEYALPQVAALLTERAHALDTLTLENFLTGLLNKRLGQIVQKAAGLVPLSRSVAGLTPQELAKLAALIKDFPLEVSGTPGFHNAQVTAGGLCTADFQAATLESKLCPQFYAAGEVLDIDGDCGGYNLQWAWSSGYLAGESAGKKLCCESANLN